MKVNGVAFRSIWYDEHEKTVKIIDQTLASARIPDREAYNKKRLCQRNFRYVGAWRTANRRNRSLCDRRNNGR